MANLVGKNMVPEPIDTTATARLALALGKDSAVYFLEVADILEFAMAHLHMVSQALAIACASSVSKTCPFQAAYPPLTISSVRRGRQGLPTAVVIEGGQRCMQVVSLVFVWHLS